MIRHGEFITENVNSIKDHIVSIVDSMNNQVYKAIQVLREMLLDRNVASESLQFLDQFQPDILEVLYRKPIITIAVPDTHYMFVFSVNSKPKIPDLKKEVEDAAPGHCILVVNDKLNVSENKKLEQLIPGLTFQVFMLRELQFNISKHTLVPKHELIVDANVIASILSAYDLKSKHQLPFILKTDAMCRYLNAQAGNLIKVTRVSPTSATSVVYRCVV